MITDYCTTMVPTMVGWMEQWYPYVPGVVMVTVLLVAPGATFPPEKPLPGAGVGFVYWSIATEAPLEEFWTGA
jgi:hypothetical protein